MNNKGYWNIGPSSLELLIILVFAILGVWKFVEFLIYLVDHIKWQ